MDNIEFEERYRNATRLYNPHRNEIYKIPSIIIGISMSIFCIYLIFSAPNTSIEDIIGDVTLGLWVVMIIFILLKGTSSK